MGAETVLMDGSHANPEGISEGKSIHTYSGQQDDGLSGTDGKTVWSFQADGAIDSPPTVSRGLAVFGTRTGSVCLSFLSLTNMVDLIIGSTVTSELEKIFRFDLITRISYCPGGTGMVNETSSSNVPFAVP